MALVTRYLHEKRLGKQDATEQRLNRLEGICCLLLQVEAAHALSWLWHNDVLPVINAVGNVRQGNSTSTSLRMALPALRRRARRRGVVLTLLFQVGGDVRVGEEVSLWHARARVAGSGVSCRMPRLLVRTFA